MESEEVPPVCCCWSAAKLRPTLGNPMDYGMPGSSVLHYLPELAQTDVHWVGDAIYLILCRSHLLCLQSFPAPGSFPMSWLFASGGQSIGVSALASVVPVNIQEWFPLGLTGLILLSKGLSKVFSSTTSSLHPYKRCVVYRGAIIPVFQLRKQRPRITQGDKNMDTDIRRPDYFSLFCSGLIWICSLSLHLSFFLWNVKELTEWL